MSFIKRIIANIKRLFSRENNKNNLLEEKQDEEVSERENFLDEIKVNVEKKKSRKKVETRTCEGDGLGIQKKMWY